MDLTCVIVDDEELMVSLFSDYIGGIKGLQLTGTFTDSVKALKYLVSTPPDFLFLDIQMPQLTGLDIVRSLPTLPYIIFITSTPDYAVESYSLNVADYLLKPVNELKFKEAVEKALKRINASLPSNLNEPLTIYDNFIFIKIGTKYTRVYFDDILYVEAEKDFTRLFTTQHTHITSVSLKTFEDTLPKNQFIRTHRSYLINLKHVQSIEVDQVHISKYQIPLGITYKDAVLKTIIGNKLIR